VVNLADCLIELLRGSFERKVVPMEYSSWKEWTIVIISRINVICTYYCKTCSCWYTCTKSWPIHTNLF